MPVSQSVLELAELGRGVVAEPNAVLVELAPRLASRNRTVDSLVISGVYHFTRKTWPCMAKFNKAIMTKST